MRPMTFDKAWGSHLGVLTKLVGRTAGPVLELGMGLFSTPVLHWMCYTDDRKLVSYDNEPAYERTNSQYASDTHQIHLIEDWEKIDIESEQWDVALIDVRPALMRKELAKKLVNNCKFVILHDTQAITRREYRYEEIYPLFKYRWNWDKSKPNTTVLSNTVDISRGI